MTEQQDILYGYVPPNKSWTQQAALQKELCMLGRNVQWAEGTGEVPFDETNFPSQH